MVVRKVTIAVDKRFFENVFEKGRKKMQKQLGVTNLSQANFTKMIRELKLDHPQNKIPKFKLKNKVRKKNDFFSI